MSDFITDIFFSEMAIDIVQAFFVFVLFFALSRLSAFIYSVVLKDNSERQRQFMLRKFTSYALFVTALVIVLKIFGVELKVILGAAGVLSLAVGFAAQTSVSNLISGLFLMFERPFVVGDVVEVNGVRGEVLTIDLLSMRMRTMDNTLVRVPNESVMKTPVINYSHFPIRRHDILFTVSYTADLEVIKKILLGIVEKNQHCLEEPEPLFIVHRVGEYYLEIKFGVWGETHNFLLLQSTFGEQMREAFIYNKIDLPKRYVHVENTNV